LPNCCVDEDPEEPDGECEDGNPCTVDYCIPVGNSFQCRSIGMGDPGCCATAQTCPDDHVQCTDRVCSANDCELQGEADCTLVSPYKMSFSEGHVIYGAQYESIATFGWSAMDRGTDGAAAFFGMDSNGDEGPDQHLALLPTGTVASFDACVALPPFDTRANYFAKLRFTFSAEVLSDGCQVHALAMKGTDWAEAVDMPGPGLDNNIPSTSFTFELPQDAMNSATTRVALCVMGPSTANLTAVRFDNVLLYKSKPYAFITDPCESHGKYGDGICDRGCTEVDPDCETSSAPTSDFCEEQGWYGDGICDAECPQPDPDCGDSGQSGGVTSGDICEEQGWYNDGICDEGCPNPDPDC